MDENRNYVVTWDIILKVRSSFFIAFLLVILGSVTLYGQQQITVTGQVTDESNTPLPGATILIEGTNIGAVTNVDGFYEIVTTGTSVLAFSFVGHETRRVPVDNRTRIDIELPVVRTALDELVVIGYGRQRRSQITGSISSLSGQDIENKPVASLDAHLLGRTSGVRVVQTTGEPGGGLSVSIRGIASIQAGTDPLYVVDGVPVRSGDPSVLKRGGSLNALADINPNDIESVEVLKDAAAAAIYGSRASGGVVLITTKRGVIGRPQVSLSAYSGVQRIYQYLEVANGRQAREIFTENWYDNNSAGNYRDIITDSLNQRFSGNVHQQDRLFSHAPINNADLSVSGGTEQIRYSLSTGYFDQVGILANTGYSRISGRSNVEYQAGSFRIGSNVAYARSDHDMARTQGAGNGNFSNWTNKPSYQPPEDDLGRISQQEPLINLTGPTQKNTRNRLTANIYLEYEIFEGLDFRTNLAMDEMQVRENIFYPSFVVPVGQQRRSRAYSGQDFGWINENTLTYSKTISDVHNLSAMVGYSQQKDQRETMIAEASQAASDKIPTVNAGAVFENATSTQTEWAMVSYISRLLYDYDNRYYLTASLRRDGSSRFGQDTRFGNFPSASLGWRISEEAFMQDIGLLDHLMLRASYGLTGNQDGIGHFISRGTVATGRDYLGRSGIGPSNMPNASLSWESTRQIAAGFDLTILQNRIAFSMEYFSKKTDDLLFNQELPGSTGYSTVLVNIGEVENKGFEFDLNTRNIEGEFRWNTTFNISFNRNRIVSLPNGEDVFFSNQLYREGEPLGTYFGYVFGGVYATDDDVPEGPTTGTKLRNLSATGQQFRGGDAIWLDLDGNGIINADDRRIIGNMQPDFVGGFSNNIGWNNFNLDIFFTYSYGNKRYNSQRAQLDGFGGLYQAVSLYAYENRWQQPGDITDVPVNSRQRQLAVTNERGNTSRFVDDASYLKLKTISLSYDLPAGLAQRISVSNAQIYLIGQNLWTLTNWRGYDPEIDDFQYPIAASVTAGIKINF